MTLWNRSFLLWWSSRSTSDCGRLIRSRRSAARLLRWESRVKTAKMPATKPAKTSSGMISDRPTSAKSGVTDTSSGGLDLDVDDLANDQRPEDLGDDGHDAHLAAQRGRPQGFDVIRLGVEHEAEQGERQGDQHHAGEPAFTGQRLDLTHDAEAFADHVADLVKDLRQVAARLPLDAHAGDEEAQIQV